MKNRNIKRLLAAFVVVGGAGLLIYSSIASAEYYKKVDELMTEPDKFLGKTLRVHGWVELGSVDEKIVEQQIKRSFWLEANGARILVHHHGPVPDSFDQDGGSEVVAKGKLAKENGEWVFHADDLMAKCPSKYEGAAKKKTKGGPTSQR